MATRGSLEWLNGILATPGFNPYSPEGQDLLNNTPRDSEAFKNLMLRQQMQVAKTGGDISNTEWWKNDPTQASAQDQSIAMSRYGDLNRQSQAFEDSEKANNGDISMLKRAIAAAAAMYGAGSFGFGTGGVDVGGSMLPDGLQYTAQGAGDAGSGFSVTDVPDAPSFYDTGGTGGYAGVGDLNVPNYGGSMMDQFPVSPSATGSSAWDTALNFGSNGGGAASGLTDLLSKLPSGTASALLRAVPGLLGAFGASQQSGKLGSLATQFGEYGAPSRARYEASFAPGFSMSQDPGFTDALNSASKSNLYALSTGGNPSLSPNAQQQNMADLYAKFSYPALQNYRNQNASTSGISAFNAAAPSAATGAVGSNAGVYNGIGSAIGSVVNPPQTLADILKQYQESNGGSSIFKVAA